MSSTRARGSIGSGDSATWPVSILETSSTLLTIASIAWPLVVMWSMKRRALGGIPSIVCSTVAKPMTPFSGVRISWLMLARNTLLASEAASAAAVLARSSSSSARRRVTSRMTVTTPLKPPLSS